MNKRNLGGIGDKIYKLRKEYGFSQWQLGKLIGVSRQTISHWESSDSDIRTENLNLLSQVFNVDISYFLSGLSGQEIIPANDDIAQLVACCDTEGKVELDSPIQEEVAKPNKLTVKAKILIVALSVCFILFIVSLGIIIRGVSLHGVNGMVDTAYYTSINLSLVNVAKILLSLAIIVAVVVTVFLILEMKKKGKKYKE